MKQYRSKSGRQLWKPSFDELEALDWEGLGFCLACGCEQPAEPDATQYECDSCGERKVYGAQELIVAGLYYIEPSTPPKEHPHDYP